MIRFSAIVSVVAIAIGLLIAGAVSGELTLVYVSIGLAALALLMLIVGVVVWRDEVFGPTAVAGKQTTAAGPELVSVPAVLLSGAGGGASGAGGGASGAEDAADRPAAGRQGENVAAASRATAARPTHRQDGGRATPGDTRVARVPDRGGAPREEMPGREQMPGRDAARRAGEDAGPRDSPGRT